MHFLIIFFYYNQCEWWTQHISCIFNYQTTYLGDNIAIPALDWVGSNKDYDFILYSMWLSPLRPIPRMYSQKCIKVYYFTRIRGKSGPCNRCTNSFILYDWDRKLTGIVIVIGFQLNMNEKYLSKKRSIIVEREISLRQYVVFWNIHFLYLIL